MINSFAILKFKWLEKIKNQKFQLQILKNWTTTMLKNKNKSHCQSKDLWKVIKQKFLRKEMKLKNWSTKSRLNLQFIYKNK